MDYTGLLSQAVAVVRRTRAVWIFAIFIALVEPPLSMGGSGTPGVNFNFDARLPVDEAALARSFATALVPFLFILLVYLVASFFLAPLARGGLVWSAARGADGEDPPIGEGFRAAGSRYGPLLLIQLFQLIVPIVFLLTIAAVGIPIAAFVLALFNGGREPNLALMVFGIFALTLVAIVILFVMILVIYVVSALVQAIVTLASVDIVLAEKGAVDALRVAWGLIRKRFLAIALIIFALAVASGVISTLAAIPMAALLILPLALSSGGIPPFGLIFAAVLILIPLMALIQTPVQALRYTYFTMLYQDWTETEVDA
ncbi:MAG: hypothetical protein U0556_19105 [Dehalococcoidia bacterium]